MAKVNDFEGVPGNNISTANSTSGDQWALVNTGTGGTIQYTTTNAIKGSTCGVFIQPTAGNQPVATQLTDTAGAASFTAVVYLYLTGYPSVEGTVPFQLRTTADGQLLSLNLSTTGAMRIKNAGGTTLVSGTSTVNLNQWYRFEFYGTGLNGSSGNFTAAFFDGHGTTAIETINITGVTTSGQTDRMRFGRMGSFNLDTWYMDAAAFTAGSSTPYGPAVTTSNVSASDSTTFTDTSALSALLSVLDALTTTDVAALATALSRVDAATLAEAATVGQLLGVSDAAALSEAAQVMLGLAVSDLLSQVEVSTETETDSGTDDAVFTESASLSIAANYFLADVFLFDDRSSVLKVAETATLRTNKIGSYIRSPLPWESRERLFYKIPVASSIIKVGGVWRDVQYPSEALVESAEYFYPGGREFTIPHFIAAELIAAGYGAYVTEDS